jgi:hypothetical protein
MGDFYARARATCQRTRGVGRIQADRSEIRQAFRLFRKLQDKIMAPEATCVDDVLAKVRVIRNWASDGLDVTGEIASPAISLPNGSRPTN